MDLPTILAAVGGLSVLIYWVIGWLTAISNGNRNGVLTPLIAFAASFGALVLYCHAPHIDLGGSRALISSWGWGDQLLVSLFIAAGGGTIADGFRTFNRNDTSVRGRLFK